ncbi:MAG: TolC family protein [Planctomycetia bacterium]|nr:TolC family protein [Planctomycetia bacterium]
MAPDNRLSLADLQATALQYNPTLAQAAAAIAQERGFWIQAGLYPNPQAGYLRTDSSQPGQTQSNGAFVSQEFVTAGKRQLSRAVEAQEIRRLTWEQRAQVMRVVNDLKVRYFEVLGAQRAIAVSQDLVRVAEDGLQATEEMLHLKQAARADVLQARLQRDAVRLGLQDARYRHEAAWRQLVTIMGRPEMLPVELVGQLDAAVPEIDFEQQLSQLLKSSPQLRAAEAELSHAQAELARERAGRIPNVTLQTVTEHDRTAQSTNLTTLIAAPVPFFNRNQGNIYHAEADIRVASAELQRVRLVLRDQLSDSFRRYQTARNQVDRLQQSMLKDAKENLDLTMEGYRQGEFDLVRVLSARQTYTQANLAYTEAIVEARKVLVEIEGLQLTGGLNPATLGAAIQTGPGGTRQRGLLNQLQDTSTRQLLPATIQATAP